MQEPPEFSLGFRSVTRKTRTLFDYPAIHNTNMENLLDFVPKFYFSDGRVPQIVLRFLNHTQGLTQ